MKKSLKNPFELVASVLDLNVSSLSDKSAMGETVHWDSLNHIGIITAIENNYGISIPDEEIEKYLTMKAIIELYEEQRLLK